MALPRRVGSCSVLAAAVPYRRPWMDGRRQKKAKMDQSGKGGRAPAASSVVRPPQATPKATLLARIAFLAALGGGVACVFRAGAVPWLVAPFPHRQHLVWVFGCSTARFPDSSERVQSLRLGIRTVVSQKVRCLVQPAEPVFFLY